MCVCNIFFKMYFFLRNVCQKSLEIMITLNTNQSYVISILIVVHKKCFISKCNISQLAYIQHVTGEQDVSKLCQTRYATTS